LKEAYVLFTRYGHDIISRNSYTDCINRFENSDDEKATIIFCQYLQKVENSLDPYLDQYDQKNKYDILYIRSLLYWDPTIHYF
jgi:hypothetical protein